MNIAIITARGGSKGIPKKNIQLLNGKPLIAYTIEAAKQSDLFDRIIVSTDSDEIASISIKYGAEIMHRPKELATDSAKSADVILYVLECLDWQDEFPVDFVLLQPTSPLRTSQHIIEAYTDYIENKYTSLVSICEASETPYKMLVKNSDGDIEPLFTTEHLSKPRQTLPECYNVNGAIYICNVKEFIKSKGFFSENIGYYKMDKKSSLDIDNEQDLKCAADRLANSSK